MTYYQRTDEELKCRFCQSKSLLTDWAQGDRVCTNCGVVNEERVRDDRQEWNDFNDGNEAKPTVARCGLVANDELKYHGGLQPTTISTQPFGGTYGPSAGGDSLGTASMRLQLVRSHHRIEKMLSKRHAQNIREKEYARKMLVRRRQQIRRKRLDDRATDASVEASICEDDEGNIKEEDDVIGSSSDSLASEKWSLERALLLHGNENEVNSLEVTGDFSREELVKKLKKAEKAASLSIYQAYRTLTSMGRKLSLPDRVINESCHIFCQYIGKKNGFHVRGVRKIRKMELENIKDSKAEKYIRECDREDNKKRVIVALSSAILYVCAKKLGWARTLVDVTQAYNGNGIKPNTCWKVIAELKIELPELFQALMNPAVEAASLVEYATKSLELPSAAIGAIRTLALHFGKLQMETGCASSTKPSIICAAAIYFVCLAGDVMQRLARQAMLDTQMPPGICNKKRRFPLMSNASANVHHSRHHTQTLEKVKNINTSVKKRKVAEVGIEPKSHNSILNEKLVNAEKARSLKRIKLETLDGNAETVDIKSFSPDVTRVSLNEFNDGLKSVGRSDQKRKVKRERCMRAKATCERRTFDALSSDPVNDEKQDRELEVHQGWFSWSNQKCWGRDLHQIENSSTASRLQILEFYKKYFHANRLQFLQVLQDFMKTSVDGDVCYLVSITAAAPLMIVGQQ